jgi:hypothetical protein
LEAPVGNAKVGGAAGRRSGNKLITVPKSPAKGEVHWPWARMGPWPGVALVGHQNRSIDPHARHEEPGFIALLIDLFRIALCRWLGFERRCPIGALAATAHVASTAPPHPRAL